MLSRIGEKTLCSRTAVRTMSGRTGEITWSSRTGKEYYGRGRSWGWGRVKGEVQKGWEGNTTGWWGRIKGRDGKGYRINDRDSSRGWVLGRIRALKESGGGDTNEEQSLRRKVGTED